MVILDFSLRWLFNKGGYPAKSRLISSPFLFWQELQVLDTLQS